MQGGSVSTLIVQPYNAASKAAGSAALNVSTAVVGAAVNVNSITNYDLFRVHGNASNPGKQLLQLTFPDPAIPLDPFRRYNVCAQCPLHGQWCAARYRRPEVLRVACNLPKTPAAGNAGILVPSTDVSYPYGDPNAIGVNLAGWQQCASCGQALGTCTVLPGGSPYNQFAAFQGTGIAQYLSARHPCNQHHVVVWSRSCAQNSVSPAMASQAAAPRVPAACSSSLAREPTVTASPTPQKTCHAATRMRPCRCCCALMIRFTWQRLGLRDGSPAAGDAVAGRGHVWHPVRASRGRSRSDPWQPGRVRNAQQRPVRHADISCCRGNLLNLSNYLCVLLCVRFGHDYVVWQCGQTAGCCAGQLYLTLVNQGNVSGLMTTQATSCCTAAYGGGGGHQHLSP